MSRFMQIRIQIQAVYRPDLRAHFPKLARVLEELRADVDPYTVSLYSLVTELERALHGDLRPGLRRVMESHLGALVQMRNAVDEKLSTWEHRGLDELLYAMEDRFQDLERDLD